jgi:UDP-N-acetylmuramate dehydrogenase
MVHAEVMKSAHQGNSSHALDDWQAAWMQRMLKKDSPKATGLSTEVGQWLASHLKGEIHSSAPLAPLSSMKVGGLADYLVYPADSHDLNALLVQAKLSGWPLHFLGWGSNTLIRDGGLRSIVVGSMPHWRQITNLPSLDDDFGIIEAQAGVKLGVLIESAKNLGYGGLAGLIGVPGTLGGAIVMNAGARGIQMSDFVTEVLVMNSLGEERWIPAQKMGFRYRHSDLPHGSFVMAAKLRLPKQSASDIEQAITTFRQLRQSTQPIDYPSLGSIFKNPEPLSKKDKPLKAAEIIEDCGLKGIRIGGARVSPKHANFIINESNASAHDVEVLINLVRDKVRETIGIKLETEVKIIGEPL